MKMKIAFRYYSFFVSTVYGQDILTERHYYKNRFSKSKQSPERLPEIKNNTLFVKKNEVVRLSASTETLLRIMLEKFQEFQA
jgi:hypothetical protein